MMYDIDRLKRKQLELGLTTLALSKKCRLPESTLRTIFYRGSAHPANVRKVAKALGVNMADIVVEEEPLTA